jgi:hypothetical protein
MSSIASSVIRSTGDIVRMSLWADFSGSRIIHAMRMSVCLLTTTQMVVGAAAVLTGPE